MSLRWRIAREKLWPISCSTWKMYAIDSDPIDLSNIRQRAETDFFSGDPLRALSTLVYSDNVDLQRSASLTFAEITERGW